MPDPRPQTEAAIAKLEARREALRKKHADELAAINREIAEEHAARRQAARKLEERQAPHIGLLVLRELADDQVLQKRIRDGLDAKLTSPAARALFDLPSLAKPDPKRRAAGTAA